MPAVIGGFGELRAKSGAAKKTQDYFGNDSLAGRSDRSAKDETENPNGGGLFGKGGHLMRPLLVLEDDSLVIKMMRHMLKRYSVLEAFTAEEALRHFKGHDGNVGLLIADVTLPIGSGIQVALLLRLENPDLPVILTSDYCLRTWTDRDTADFNRLRSDSVIILQKPFQAQRLLNCVRELISLPQAEKARTA